MSLGYDSLLANLYWTRAVQYYGGKQRDRDPNFELLSPLLDLTTTLDPNLLVAYKFGAMFLAEPPPRGAGRPDLAVALILRGIVANPNDWRLWHDLGFIYYWDMKDYEKASQAYRQGSKHPKARDWMRVMAAKIAQEGGSRETSRFLWREIYESTKDPNIRKNALDHLTGLKAEEDAETTGKAGGGLQQSLWPASEFGGRNGWRRNAAARAGGPVRLPLRSRPGREGPLASFQSGGLRGSQAIPGEPPGVTYTPCHFTRLLQSPVRSPVQSSARGNRLPTHHLR